MKPTQVPRIMEIMNHIWFGMCLILLLTFTLKITGLTAAHYGALPAAVVFGVLGLMVLYAVHFMTSRGQRA